MGTFLYECINNLHFDNLEELLARLKVELLELGECGISEVRMLDRKANLVRLDELSRPNAEGEIVLDYNKYERRFWEPSYVSFDTDKFSGIRSHALGSKIGYSKHYQAMLVARVLCECYSSGTYMVGGDVSYRNILRALAYIGKKYDFSLVKTFISNRCNLTNFDTLMEDGWHRSLYWGYRGDCFYYKDFLATSSLDEWVYAIKNEQELKAVENGETIKYVRDEYYLGIRLLLHMLLQDFKEIGEIDESTIYNMLVRYCAGLNSKEYKGYLDSLPSDIANYKNFYCRYIDADHHILEDIDLITKSISLLYPESASIAETAKKRFVACYADKDCSQINDSKQLAIALKVQQIQKNRHEHLNNVKVEDEISNEVKSIMQQPESVNIMNLDAEEVYLNERHCITGNSGNISEMLINEIELLFSDSLYLRFVSNWKYEERTMEDTINCLFDVMERIDKDNRILMSEAFFYKMLDSRKIPEMCFRLDFLCFMLENSKSPREQTISYLVIENDSLYEKYVNGKRR